VNSETIPSDKSWILIGTPLIISLLSFSITLYQQLVKSSKFNCNLVTKPFLHAPFCKSCCCVLRQYMINQKPSLCSTILYITFLYIFSCIGPVKKEIPLRNVQAIFRIALYCTLKLLLLLVIMVQIPNQKSGVTLF
jgi:hypothetical protein